MIADGGRLVPWARLCRCGGEDADHRDTVFRTGSLTKTLTAIVVMQPWERGSWTWTRRRTTTFAASGWSQCSRICGRRLCDISYAYRRRRLLAAAVGSASAGPGFGRPSGTVRAPRLAEYYRRGLPVEVEPGTKWAYSNHGFGALGQIVEDVRASRWRAISAITSLIRWECSTPI